MKETVGKVFARAEAAEARVKELEGYLERYETITQEMEWVVKSWWEEQGEYDLAKLRQDIKQESTDD